jgi:hypothetical protein
LNFRIKGSNEMEEVIQYFITLESNVVFNTHPKKEIKETDNIPLHIRELVTEKRRARSRWQTSRNNDYRLIYSRLSRKLHNALKNEKNETLEHYTVSLSKDDHTIWKATKSSKDPKYR